MLLSGSTLFEHVAFLGVSREALTMTTGVVASLAVAILGLGVVWLSLGPILSKEWAASLGADDLAEPGPDPAEVIDGRTEPIPAQSGGQDGSALAADPDIDVHAEEGRSAADVPSSDPSA